MNDADTGKRAAAAYAVQHLVQDKMRLGLGSGSTALHFVHLLGQRVQAEGLAIQAVATSRTTAAAAMAAGIALVDLNDADRPLDLTLDGADEIDATGQMIKGGGACLLWEKIVAQASRRMICLADASKQVPRLGRFPLPIEVVRFGWRATRDHIAAACAGLQLPQIPLTLRGDAHEPLVTDSGNYILDAAVGMIPDAPALAQALITVPGVVEHGLFLGIAQGAVLGAPDGQVQVLEFTPG